MEADFRILHLEPLICHIHCCSTQVRAHHPSLYPNNTWISGGFVFVSALSVVPPPLHFVPPHWIHWEEYPIAF